MSLDCNEVQLMLPDSVDGNLSLLQQQRLDQHLNHCEACSEHLADLWQLQATASRWQDLDVPAWKRREAFFPESSWLPNLQWVSSFASVLVLVLVMTSANIDTRDGLSISFGHRGVDEARIASLMAELEQKQQTQLDSTVATFNNQQVATNQLLLRTVMEMNREERKEDLSTLLSVWDATHDQRSQQTEESLSVLFASQMEDRRNIDQINRLLRQASLEGSNL